jgi:hypothetical protein
MSGEGGVGVIPSGELEPAVGARDLVLVLDRRGGEETSLKVAGLNSNHKCIPSQCREYLIFYGILKLFNIIISGCIRILWNSQTDEFYREKCTHMGEVNRPQSGK